ncbi:hypothetical protein WJX81_006138 [Elliptochloris bilobata]|uniref:SET domain-containing protein n=1 Tax=Elliptochloris bilobata TaxID=381761 RepID=A0AAW1RMZ3_9CHLO
MIPREGGRGRGLVAFRNMAKNQIAVQLPKSMAFQLAPVSKALEESAEMLLEPKHENVAPWFQVWWESLPTKADFLWRRQPFPADKLELLQDGALASNLTKALDYTRKYFQKAMTVKGTFEDFAEAAALVNAYAFSFHDDQGLDVVRTMLPLIDLANHAEAGEATLAVMQGADLNFYAYTTRDVAAGEELTLPYPHPASRPDQALFHYGFLPGGVHAELAAEPKLAALDLPGGSLHEAPTFSEEDYLPLGRLQTQAELDRLKALLAAFPTSEAEDARLLGGALEDPHERLFVAFRLQRKRALAAAAARLEIALQEDAALAELEALEGSGEEAAELEALIMEEAPILAQGGEDGAAESMDEL